MNAVLAWLGRKKVIGRRRFDWAAQSNDVGADRKPKNVALRAQLEPIRRGIAPSISIGSVETLRIELTDPQRPRLASVIAPTTLARLKPAAGCSTEPTSRRRLGSDEAPATRTSRA